MLDVEAQCCKPSPREVQTVGILGLKGQPGDLTVTDYLEDPQITIMIKNASPWGVEMEP